MVCGFPHVMTCAAVINDFDLNFIISSMASDAAP